MIARCAGASYLGVVLTGMGNDGAAGMLVMKKSGVFNLIQDEASCLAVGMPKKAIIAGGADKENVEKSRQRRSRHFAVLTYSMYAPRVKMAVALLDGLF